ncbi:ZmpA/ZmpB/ZmpC family metallo-endopeptidase [Streptococcus sp. 1032]|uniref:ZmpA/ZmpB/ZmpC family metallo-endopeptidase n=1 Tax=Streptococcus sp. 1032 TaxID=2582657 RepID=UPI001F037811|nr:ZmpA/ZmpB/ZmpC family metallo-endopeptidase [Streptococcus sp. 1032]
MRQTNVRGSLSLRGFRKLRTGAIVATGVILLGLGFLAPTVSASEQDGVWVARTVEEVKADLQKEGDLFKYVIKWGDTLSVISEASNIPVDVLQEMNQASGKNLFLPHNELYFTEAETVSDTVTKHKIVIKESGASGEVRTYEVLLKKDQETKAVTFELTDVTEKVEKMTVNYSLVYQPVSAPVVERAEESGEEPASEAPAETSPEVKEETEAPVAPKAEEPTVTTPKAEKPVSPAPTESAPEVEKPAEPKEAESTPEGTFTGTAESAPDSTELVANGASGRTEGASEVTPGVTGKETEESGTEAPTTPKEDTPEGTVSEGETGTESAELAEPKTEAPTTPENKEEQPGAPAAEGSSEATLGSTEEASGTTPKAEVSEAPVVEATTSGEQSQPAEETPAPSKPETPASTEAATEATTSSEVGNAEETSVEETGKQDSATNTPSAESKEEAVTTPEATEKEAKAEESAEPGTSAAVESTPAGEEGKAEATEEAEEPGIIAEATPAPKESGEEGKAEDSVSSTESSSTASEGESTATQPAVEEETDSTSEAEELATTETATAPKAEEPEAATPASEVPSESESKEEDSSAGDTTVTEEQPASETVSEGGLPATQPAGEENKSEPTSETSTIPSVDATNDSGNSESSPSVTEGNKEETNSQNTEASTVNENSESSNSDSEKPQGDEPAVQVGSDPTASTEGTSTGKEESAPKAEEKQVDKKLELRNISNVELFTVENNKYCHVTSLATLPSNPDTYFMKVKSENFKDVMLPVSSITSVTRDSQEVYKIVGQANDLIQHENDSTVENYTYYLPKTINSENEVYTSFKNLVEAMNRNLHGTFRLGATMDAREVELSDGQESYINQEFSGTLIGTNNDKNYAIYNLKKPLFKVLNHAAIQDLSIKEANVSLKEDATTIAKEANNGTTITNVHSSGVIAGERSIGGLVSKVTDSTISNSSFTGRITNTYNTNATYQIGGLVGKLSGVGALIENSISSIDMATNANQGDQTVGGIAGVVDRSARISNSYVEGNLNNVKPFGKVGGVVGNLWDNSGEVENSGRLSDVLSDVNVTNGNAIAGYDFNGIKATNTYSNKNNKVVKVVQVDDEVLSKDSEEQRGTVLEADEINVKKSQLVPKNNIKTEDFNFSSKYGTDYSKLKDVDVSRLRVYKNIEKLLPFYNRETIVKYGNLVDTNNALYTKDLVSVVSMHDKEVISDINKHKASINKLLLHYSDNTSQTLDIKYLQDFSKVAEYEITNTKLIYTPNTLLHNYNNIVKSVLNDLKSVQYNSADVRKVLDISNDIKLTELYLDEQFDKTKANIEDTLSKLLSADAAIAENNNSIIDNYVVEKIKNNKEALLLGLTYLERWYNFKYDNASTKDLVLYHLDFFGKSNSSALDNVIELGKSGFNNLLAKNNVITYNVLLSKNYGTKSLFEALEKYRKVLVPNKTNNEWFKEQSKAYIVEEKSTIPEVSEKQSKEGTKYSIGVYDRLTSPSWKYQSMVLPLLTLPEKSVFMIANISTIGFGAYDRYRSSEYPKGEKLNKFVEDNAQEAAKRFRDHYDYWYKILDTKEKDKLFRSILVYDSFRFGNDKDKNTSQADFETDHPAIKHFFGPAGNNVVHNGHGAYATGDAFYYMAYRMLDKAGAVTYTHEMTHNSDREIYLGGYGRRNGLGPEFYAKGLLQAPDHPDDATITINSVLKYDEAENANRLQVKNPTQRFNNAEDLRKYMHNLFDLVYTLEKLEGEAVVNLGANEKGELLRKIENEYKPDPDGNDVYATNVVRRLKPDELNKLTSFNSLIENDIITRRGYIDEGEYKRNGYYTINLFSPIYSALSSDKGTPGDLMARRMAFELLAAKGYKEGMVPYISNQYENEAKANGSKINSYGKEVGLVTDKLVLNKIFNNQYSSWADFKKAMYKERENKFNNLTNISFINPNNWGRQETITIDSIAKLRNIIKEAVQADATNYASILYPKESSKVYKLKKAIFKAYLDKTDDFRSSIFDEENKFTN